MSFLTRPLTARTALGWTLVVVGGYFAYGALTMDTTVEVAPVEILGQRFGGGQRVHNFGLLHAQQNGLIIAAAAALAGLILLATAPPAPAAPRAEPGVRRPTRAELWDYWMKPPESPVRPPSRLAVATGAVIIAALILGMLLALATV
jgi:hypothetical protein